MEADFDLRAGDFFDASDDLADLFEGACADFGIEGAQGAPELDHIGNDVGILAAADLADGEDDGVVGVGCTGDELVEGAD